MSHASLLRVSSVRLQICPGLRPPAPLPFPAAPGVPVLIDPERGRGVVAVEGALPAGRQACPQPWRSCPVGVGRSLSLCGRVPTSMQGFLGGPNEIKSMNGVPNFPSPQPHTTAPHQHLVTAVIPL